jgi:O-antigen/teichoic acid export membrane protein
MTKRPGILGCIGFNCLDYVISIIAAVLITPLILRSLGAELYGLYALLSGIVGYSAIFEFGLGQAVQKCVAQHAALDERSEVNRSISASVLINGSTGLLVGFLLCVFAARVVVALHTPVRYSEVAVQCVYAASAALFFALVSSSLSASLMGLRRYDLTGKVNSTVATVLALTIAGLLLAKRGVLDLIIATFAANVATMLIFAYLLCRTEGQFRFHLRPGRRLTVQLLRFGAHVFVTKLSGLSTTSLMRLLIGFVAGPAAVAYYVIPQRIILAVGGLLSNAAAVVLPSASELAAKGEGDRLRRLYVSALSYQVFLAVPLLSFVAIAAPELLSIWIGPEMAQRASTTMRLLSLAAILGSVGTLPALMSLALGQSSLLAKYSLVSTGIAVILAVRLGRQWGAEGAAVAVVLACAVWPAYFYQITVRHFAVDWWGLLRRSFAPPLLCTAVLVLCVEALRAIHHGSSLTFLLLAGTFLSATLVVCALISDEVRPREMWAKWLRRGLQCESSS